MVERVERLSATIDTIGDEEKKLRKKPKFTNVYEESTNIMAPHEERDKLIVSRIDAINHDDPENHKW